VSRSILVAAVVGARFAMADSVDGYADQPEDRRRRPADLPETPKLCSSYAPG